MSKWKEAKENDNLALPTLRGTFDTKSDGMFALWSPRYWNQEGDKLFYYKSKVHLEHLGVIALTDILSVRPRLTTERQTRYFVAEILTAGGTMYIDLKSQHRLDSWIIGVQKWVRYFEAQKQKADVITQPSIQKHAKSMLKDLDSKNTQYGKKVLKSVLGSDSDDSEFLQNIAPRTPSKKNRTPPTPMDSDIATKEKIELLEDWVQRQVAFIEEMGFKWSETEDRHKEEIKDLVDKFESKKNQYESLIAKKDQQLQEERQLRWKQDQGRDQELLAKLTDLEERNRILEEENNRLKQQNPAKETKENIQRNYFFALASTFGLGSDKDQMNNLYTQAREGKIPMDMWDQFLQDNCNQ
eukprot:TRINITY_DN4756_c0_g1_i1.p1 TRINITY_DN4756_c0_g1~~TRINITY_DN4756_c0_g1_i1.p1  ORF type:complete len:355 (-),score=73.61 TRINITY_DN4756_c0_g1_i1:13-1077(-)